MLESVRAAGIRPAPGRRPHSEAGAARARRSGAGVPRLGGGNRRQERDERVSPGREPPWGLYVHIPFCPYKCDYCDFVAVGGGSKVARWHAAYPALVLAEARRWVARLRPRPPVSFFYGGGTPTLLPPQALADLHRGLTALLAPAPDAAVPGGSAEEVPEVPEVSVEANPGTVTVEGLSVLRAAGFNRLSLGLQAAQDDVLAALGRGHTFADFLAAFGAARAAGFEHVSVDLMYGLPGQGTAQFASGLRAVLALGPEHLSIYGLQLEEGTPFHARVGRGTLTLPDEDACARQYAVARRLCARAGFEHYEISNFARPGRRCRHNLLYWRNADYLGLGVGAHSHWHQARWANTPRLAAYRDAVGAADFGWVCDREPADAGRERRETAFLGLRLLWEGIDLGGFAERHGVSLDAAFPGVAADLVREGLCTRDATALRLKPEAVAVGNRAFAAFV